MKRLVIAALIALVAIPHSVASAEEKSGKSKPNFIFILAEAHGWSSTSVDMDGAEPSHARPAGLTPNLERIAKEGMRFSEFYVSAPRCTPSRASFFTGISPAKLHMTYVNEGGKERRGSGEDVSDAGQRVVPPSPRNEIPEGVPTTGTLLGRVGYATAHFGKWHVGRLDPTQHGFDVSDGPNTNQGPERGEPNPKQCFAITERGIEFMKEQVRAEKPFFLQLSHYGAGTDTEATPESFEETRKALPNLSGKALASAAGVRDMDKAIGQVLAAIEELGIAKNTYVFYSADHGNQGGNAGRNNNGPNPPLSGARAACARAVSACRCSRWGPTSPQERSAASARPAWISCRRCSTSRARHWRRRRTRTSSRSSRAEASCRCCAASAPERSRARAKRSSSISPTTTSTTADRLRRSTSASGSSCATTTRAR
jgi:arylsulfatase A-like enzyme